MKKNACIKSYDAPRPLYLETSASGVHLGTRLLQVRDDMNCGHDEMPDNETLHPIAFPSKSLSHADWHYRNIEHEVLDILHGLGKFQYYCFASEVCIVTHHKPLASGSST